MMKILWHPVFLICSITFVVHQILQKIFAISLPVADSYLDSFVAMPIILTLLVVERRYLFRKGERYRLTVLEIVVATIFIAFVSEIIFPLFSEKFTGDWLDGVFFGLGSVLFYFTINRKR